MHPTSVPYAKLVLNPAINARGELTDADVADLVASIPTEGLLQPLLVRPYGETMFEIVEGSRRHRAINILIDKDLWKIETEIPVLCRDMTDEEAREASLLANIQRLDLAPAEEAAAFVKLESDGQTPEAISAHFGSTIRYVKQRLAIGKLPLPIFNALADGTISVEAAQAFTLSANEGLQLQVFNDLGNGNRYHASSIRDALVKKSVSASSREAKFVGEADYVAAGGAVTRDLFSENVFFEDGPLLQKLFDVKIEEARAGLLESGWSDVIIARDGKPRVYQFEKSKPQDKNLSEEARARLATIKGEIEELDVAMTQMQDDEEEDTYDPDKWEVLEAKSVALNLEADHLRASAFTDRQKKKCIAIIEIDYSTVNFHLGLIDPKQAKKKKGSVSETDDDELGEFINTTTKSTANFEEADFTGALRDEMSITMDTALRATMMQKPQAAWYCLLASMVMAAQSNGYNAPLHTAQARHGASDVNDLVKSLFQSGEDEEDDSKLWNFADILTKLESLDAEVLGKLSGGLIARHLNVMKRLIDANVQALITRMDPDVIKIWQPDAAFFKKLKAADLTEALIEINHGTLPEGVSAKAKKAELVVKATELAPASGWLPKPLRTASYVGPGSEHYKAAPELENLPSPLAGEGAPQGAGEGSEAVQTADQELEAA
jgi:ParB family transcriptional regulator, chromosome partitioning protein